MMYRAAIERAHALLDLAREEQAIADLRMVAEQDFGADAVEARAMLEQLWIRSVMLARQWPRPSA